MMFMKISCVRQTWLRVILAGMIVGGGVVYGKMLRGPGAFEKNSFTVEPQRREVESDPAEGLGRVYAGQLVYFYQHILSRVMPSPCKMHPSCSVYSQHAITEHGVAIGVMMTADRLMHEGGEQEHAPRIWVGDELRYHDPVSRNDFWWRE